MAGGLDALGQMAAVAVIAGVVTGIAVFRALARVQGVQVSLVAIVGEEVHVLPVMALDAALRLSVAERAFAAAQMGDELVLVAVVAEMAGGAGSVAPGHVLVLLVAIEADGRIRHDRSLEDLGVAVAAVHPVLGHVEVVGELGGQSWKSEKHGGAGRGKDLSHG